MQEEGNIAFHTCNQERRQPSISRSDSQKLQKGEVMNKEQFDSKGVGGGENTSAVICQCIFWQCLLESGVSFI